MRERIWAWNGLFEILKPTPSDQLPPTRPHFLILLNSTTPGDHIVRSDQIVKSMSLLEPLSFKPAQSKYVLWCAFECQKLANLAWVGSTLWVLKIKLRLSGTVSSSRFYYVFTVAQDHHSPALELFHYLRDHLCSLVTVNAANSSTCN